MSKMWSFLEAHSIYCAMSMNIKTSKNESLVLLRSHSYFEVKCKSQQHRKWKEYMKENPFGKRKAKYQKERMVRKTSDKRLSMTWHSGRAWKLEQSQGREAKRVCLSVSSDVDCPHPLYCNFGSSHVCSSALSHVHTASTTTQTSEDGTQCETHRNTKNETMDKEWKFKILISVLRVS